MTSIPLPDRLDEWRRRVEHQLDRILPAETAQPQRLHAAQRYSVLGPGKRIRPALVYATAETLGVPAAQVDAAACAVELIHAYSLVHDDLPAMDDDDLRRGRPTCHRAFDLASHPGAPADAATRVRLIETLADASGTSGMAGGQALDLAAEGQSLSLAEIEQIHVLKTGALIRASVVMAAHCAPSLGMDHLQSLADFGSTLGIAFQIQDDLLDVEGDVSLIGKATGSDEARAMPTYPAVAGLESARARVRDLHERAGKALEMHGWGAGPLAALADWLLTRRH
jgi:geranylgeranyl pyrophosphate synthase